MAKRLSKTTKGQYEMLLNFVEKNKILLSGKTKPSELNHITHLWGKFAVEVNCAGLGPSKTAEQWRKIFSEWKVNTRRRSRAQEIEKLGTGGGPSTSKGLSDLEERLLGVISKIHLGDSSLAEPLDMDSNALSTECIINSTVCSNIEIVEDSEPGNSEINKTTSQTPSRKRPASNTDHSYTTKKPSSSRYTSSILQSACETYEAASRLDLESKQTKNENVSKVASGLEALAAALNKHTEVIKDLETAKLKFKYYKLFGNTDNFKSFFDNKYDSI